MDIRQLRYFVTVADAGHITRAAAVLGMQQPPLSQQIKAMEAQLGVTLFIRHPKGVSLTPVGQEVLAEARHALLAFDAMEQRVARITSGLRGVLHLGITTSAAMHAFTSNAIRTLRHEHPAIEMALSEANAATVVALPIDHPLALRRPTGRHAVRLEDLHEQNMILVRRPGAPGLYADLLHKCAQAQVQPRVVEEVERMTTTSASSPAVSALSVVPASMRRSRWSTAKTTAPG